MVFSFMDEKENQDELTVNDISFNGVGGIDMDGEYQWSGDYEFSISPTFSPVEYNFYATIRRRKSRNRKTIGWYITLYLALNYNNGREIKLFEKKLKTLKEAKQAIFDKIKEVHDDKEGTMNLVEQWKQNHAKPIFILDNETQNPILIGTTYESVSVDISHQGSSQNWLWYNDDVPDYKNHSIFYELSPFGVVEFRAWRLEKWYGGGHSGYTEKNKELIQKMVEIAKEKERYAWMFKKYKEEEKNLDKILA